MRIPEFLFHPLGIHAPSLVGILMRRQSVEERMVAFQSAGQELKISDFVNARRPYEVVNGIAAIHANEVLARTHTNVDKMFGDTHYNDLIAELGQAKSDPEVRGIRLDISSPGGSALGAPEAAAAVLDARQVKPVGSYIETVGASAAFYFAAASNVIIASPSAIVGSIGTISTYADISAMLERLGVKMNIMTPEVSDLKASGNPFRPMTDAEREFIQSRLESCNAAFTGWVQSQRPQVDDGAMRGNYFSGADAVGQGLVDGTGTVEDANAAIEALIAYSLLDAA